VTFKTKKIKIHRVAMGPVETDQGMWYNICLIEEPDGEIHEEELEYKTLKEAYKDINLLNSQIEPIETEVGLYEEESPCSISTVN
tara:strand:- start:415 stop:669 length:255 start_codon:yes stop_codon:yes gene_type:complete